MPIADVDEEARGLTGEMTVEGIWRGVEIGDAVEPDPEGEEEIGNAGAGWDLSGGGATIVGGGGGGGGADVGANGMTSRDSG